jgi:hypothetical protein
MVKSAKIIIDSDDEQESEGVKVKEEDPSRAPPPPLREPKERTQLQRAKELPQAPPRQRKRARASRPETKKVTLKIPPLPAKPIATETSPTAVSAEPIKQLPTVAKSTVKQPRRRTKKTSTQSDEKNPVASDPIPTKIAAVCPLIPQALAPFVPPSTSYDIPIIKQEDIPTHLPEELLAVKAEPVQEHNASELLALQLEASWGLRRSRRIPKPRIKKEIEEFTDLVNVKPPTVRRRRRVRNTLPAGAGAGTKEEPIVVEKVFIRISAEKMRNIPPPSVTV